MNEAFRTSDKLSRFDYRPLVTNTTGYLGYNAGSNGAVMVSSSGT